MGKLIIDSLLWFNYNIVYNVKTETGLTKKEFIKIFCEKLKNHREYLKEEFKAEELIFTEDNFDPKCWIYSDESDHEEILLYHYRGVLSCYVDFLNKEVTFERHQLRINDLTADESLFTETRKSWYKGIDFSKVDLLDDVRKSLKKEK